MRRSPRAPTVVAASPGFYVGLFNVLPISLALWALILWALGVF